MITRKRRSEPDPPAETPTEATTEDEHDPIIDLFNMDEAPTTDPSPGPTVTPDDDSTKWLLDQLPDPEPAPDNTQGGFDPGPPPVPTAQQGQGRGGREAGRPGDPQEPSLQYGGETGGEADLDILHQTPPEPPLSTLTRTTRRPSSKDRGTPMRIAIAATEFNYDITSMMVERARAHADVLGAQVHHIVRVPGVFDLPLAVKRLLSRDDVDGVAALGCVIEGETDHDDLVIQHAARKIIDLSLDTDKPVGLGITGPGMSRMQAMARIDRAKDAVEAAYRMHRELNAI